MIENPIFITGCYRSGTTYISRVLDTHPDFNITFDSVNYFRYILKKNAPASDFNNIVKSTLDRLKKRYSIILDNNKILNDIEKSSVINHKVIYSSIMESFFDYSKKRWGEKTLLEWKNIPTFLSMFSKGKAIHVIRDPRDVLASYKNMTFEKGERYLDAVFANLSSFNAAINYSQVLPSDRYYTLIYEDFISNKVEECRKLCSFLDIEFVKEMLDQNNFRDIFGKSFDRKTHTSFPNDNTKPMNRWKSKLSKEEIEFTEAIVGPQMTRFGYEISIDIESNSQYWVIKLLDKNPLLKERFIKYLKTGDGVESYPSDSTNPNNWSHDTGIKGQGAAKAYGKN